MKHAIARLAEYVEQKGNLYDFLRNELCVSVEVLNAPERKIGFFEKLSIWLTKTGLQPPQFLMEGWGFGEQIRAVSALPADSLFERLMALDVGIEEFLSGSGGASPTSEQLITNLGQWLLKRGFYLE